MTSAIISTTGISSVISLPDADVAVVSTQPATSSVISSAAQPGPRGATGPEGPAGAGSEWPFASPVATWTVRHNLGRHPLVQVLDTTGAQFDADVEYADVNTVVITHAQPVAGSALLS